MYFVLLQGVFFTGTPEFQYQKENHQAANHSCWTFVSLYFALLFGEAIGWPFGTDSPTRGQFKLRGF